MTGFREKQYKSNDAATAKNANNGNTMVVYSALVSSGGQEGTFYVVGKMFVDMTNHTTQNDLEREALNTMGQDAEGIGLARILHEMEGESCSKAFDICVTKRFLENTVCNCMYLKKRSQNVVKIREKMIAKEYNTNFKFI